MRRVAEWLMFLLLALVASACGTVHRDADPQLAPDLPLAGSEDSLEVVDGELSAAGESMDAVGEAMVTIDRGNRAPASGRSDGINRRRRQRAAAMPLRLDITAIHGPRSDYRAVAGVGGAFSAGVKSDDFGTIGFVHYRGGGVVRTLHAGNLSLRAGERLLLGRRRGVYPPPTLKPVRDGVTISPSLSRWFGRTGVALAAGLTRTRARAVLVGAGEHAYQPQAAWLFLTHIGRSITLGAAFGREMRRGLARARRTSVGGLHGTFAVGPVTTSVEYVAYARGQQFFAARTTHRRPAISLIAFRAPTFASGVNPMTDLVPDDRVVTGAGLILKRTRGNRRLQLSVLSAAVSSPTDHRSYRRVFVAATGKSGRHVSWQTSFYWFDETQRAFPDDAADIGKETRRRESRLRIGMRTEPNDGAMYRFHIDYLPGLDGAESGTLLSISSSLSNRGAVLQWQVTTYSLPPGRRGYITRPGAGYFEFFSTVYGRGSDVSVRLRWRLHRHLTVFGYYGTPWLKAGRAYVGAEFHFGR